MGYLSEQDNFDPLTLTVSFHVEGFGLERMKEIARDDVEQRMRDYRQMLNF